VSQADETQQLWLAYRRTGDQKIRDRLILTYAPLVKYVAGRLNSVLPRYVDDGELVAFGVRGLNGAIEGYDPERDLKFETYAMARIKAEIIDAIRSVNWEPRSVRPRASDIERATALVEASLAGLGRAPTNEEIAKTLGISEEELSESLDKIEQKEALAGLIAQLPERERLVVTLYYYEELTFREIGEVLGITESRVLQLHMKAILRLKTDIASGGAEDACHGPSVTYE
jgi:RNA polymerase sigma factor for flagellar operon FliA